MSRYTLFIPGIFQNPAGEDDWSDLACKWVGEHCPGADAGDYEYKCGIFKSPGQSRRVERCRDILNAWADHDRVLVGHSNGVDIIVRLLRENPRLKVEAIHLIAGATPAHCGANGLNGIAERGQVKRVHLYCSENDEALWWGGLSYGLLHYLGRGFGDLGRRGALNTTPALNAIMDTTWRDDLGHSDWFSPWEFDRTMRNVTR